MNLLYANLFNLRKKFNAPTDRADTRSFSKSLRSLWILEQLEGPIRNMVRIKIIARVIPEDVYNKDLESPTQTSTAQTPVAQLLEGENRILVMVNDPKEESIGMLANEIKGSFQRINHESVTSSAGQPAPLSTANLLFLQSAWGYQVFERWRGRRRS